MNHKFGALGFSLLVHALALGVLTLSFAQKPQPLATQARNEVVEVVAVDESRVQEELRRLKSSEQLQREAEQARQQRVQQELEQARKAKDEENRRVAELKQKREQEQREAELQRKQLAELKVQQARLEKEKQELEKKRQQEQELLAAAEKKRKTEEANARKAEEERRRREQIAAEAKRLAETKAAADKRAQEAQRQQLGRYLSEYEAALASHVRRNWLRPAGSAESFECKVFVQQTAGGEVVSAQVVQSCGSAVLDRSVEAAVRKASPLPAPPTPELFDKEINFTFRPR